MAETQRSPSYPGMSLPEAIKKTKSFYDANKKYAVDRSDANPVAYRSLGYTSPNGAAKRTLAALLGFGLLEKAPGSGETKVRISDRGYSIVALPEEDKDRIRALWEAVRLPKIYEELSQEFSDGLPPSDPPIFAYLVKRGYSPTSIPNLINDFRESLAFVLRYGEGDSLDSVETPKDQELESQTERATSVNKAPVNPNTSQISSGFLPQGLKALPIPLGGDKESVLQYPPHLTEEDFDFIIGFLNFVKKKIVRDSKQAPHALEVKIGPALWRTEESEIPIEVIGYKGTHGGIHYVSIANSETGVPVNEVIYEK